MICIFVYIYYELIVRYACHYVIINKHGIIEAKKTDKGKAELVM